MAFNVTALPAYTDQLSLDLISKAVLNTDLLSYVDLRPGFASGTVAINLVDTATPIVAAGCEGYPTAGNNVTYSQVNVQVDSLESKALLCVRSHLGLNIFRLSCLQVWVMTLSHLRK